MGDLGVQVSVCPFVRPSTFTQSVLWAQLLTILYQSFWNFAGVFIMVWGCACGFGYNCKIIFYHLFHFVNLVIFRPQCIDSGYLVSATPHTILYRSLKLCTCFLHGQKMCMWFGCNPCINFSTWRTFSFSDLGLYESFVTVGTLWAQLLIQFYTDLFETLHMFSPWSEDVHMIWILSLH